MQLTADAASDAFSLMVVTARSQKDCVASGGGIR